MATWIASVFGCVAKGLMRSKGMTATPTTLRSQFSMTRRGILCYNEEAGGFLAAGEPSREKNADVT